MKLALLLFLWLRKEFYTFVILKIEESMFPDSFCRDIGPATDVLIAPGWSEES